MDQRNRRSVVKFALLAPFAAAIAGVAGAKTPAPILASVPEHKMPDMGPEMSKVHWLGDEQIGMLMYPGMTVMDLIGPQSMFGSMMGAKIYLVAKSLDPVTSDAGVTIIPNATFDSCPRNLTVLFAPGGTDGTLAAAADPETLAFIADRGARAKYITSVCSGSLILGAAGLLKGYKATSHWAVRDVLAEYGAIPTEARVVRDRNRITGAGVTAGLDFGLSMVAELRDQTYAECCQLVSEYDPDPPFNAGSLRTAPERVKTAMIQLLTDFTNKAKALARSTTG